MPSVRLGAVSYLNARPLVYGLAGAGRFDIRFDLPARCADLLHAHEIDLGLVPSIEYLRGRRPYDIVAGLSVSSCGAVASVALYTRKEPRDVRSIALDTSSRTSVALTRVVARQVYRIDPELVPMAPDLDAMLARADAALIIGDVALFLDPVAAGVQKIDLGELWTRTTGLPFVYAIWAGWPDAVTPDDIAALRTARDRGVANWEDIARQSFPNEPGRQQIASVYLRDNIRYGFEPGVEEEGLRAFYRYAAELGLVSFDGELRFYHG